MVKHATKKDGEEERRMTGWGDRVKKQNVDVREGLGRRMLCRKRKAERKAKERQRGVGMDGRPLQREMRTRMK